MGGATETHLPYAPHPRELHQTPHVLRGVDHVGGVCAPPGQLRQAGQKEGEALGVADVPMEHVQLVGGHAHDDRLQVGGGYEVARGVQHDAAVGEGGGVLHARALQHLRQPFSTCNHGATDTLP